MLKKIECFIQPSKLDTLKDELTEAGVEGMSVTELCGFGRQRGYREDEQPAEEVGLLSKTKLEIVVEEEIVEDVIDMIKRLARTGSIGAGKIFIIPVEKSKIETGKQIIH